MATFSERVKDLRTQSGMTQQEVAEKLNVTKQTISQYERGQRRPDIEGLEAISDLFNVSSDYVLGKTNLTLQFIDDVELKLLRGKETSELLDMISMLTPEGIEKIKSYIMDLNAKYFKD